MAAWPQPISNRAADWRRRSCRAQRRAAGAAAAAPARRAHAGVHFVRHFDNSRLVKAPDPVRVRADAQFSRRPSRCCSRSSWSTACSTSTPSRAAIAWRAKSSSVEQLREENRQLRLTEAQLTQPAASIRWPASWTGRAAARPGGASTMRTRYRRSRVAQIHAPCAARYSRTVRWQVRLHHPPCSAVASVRASRRAALRRALCRSSGRASGSSAFSFSLWACAIAGRLFWLQIVRHQEYVERAQKQQQRTFEVAPRRGILYDRNLHELAMTVQVDSIYADPSEIDDKQAAARIACHRSSTPTLTDTQTTEQRDRRAAQRRPQLCLGRAPRDARCRRAGPRPQHEGHLLPERVPALLSRQPNCRAGAGLRGRGRQRAGRPGRKIRRASCTARPAACTRPWMRAARCSAPASTSPSPAATSCSPSTKTFSSWPSARSITRWQQTQRRQRHRRGAGRAHRPDSRARHSPHLQPQRLSPHHAGAAARSRGQRRLRAGLDLQAGHLFRRARCSTWPSPTT